jgi:hypothetical protein
MVFSEVPMRPALFLTASIGLTLLLTSRASFALDQKMGAGVAGRGQAARVTGGGGVPTDSTLAKPGFSSKVGTGSLGLVSAGKSGGAGPIIESDFHAAGLGKAVTAGKGQSTMDVVPGRVPTYINLIAGKRMEPWIGERGH